MNSGANKAITEHLTGSTVEDARDVVKGDIVKVNIRYVRPSYDSKGRKVESKERPVLVLYVERQQMVVAYITGKIPILLSPGDVIISDSSPSFEATGLEETSLIKLGYLSTVKPNDVLGWYGSIDDALREEINAKLAACFRV